MNKYISIIILVLASAFLLFSCARPKQNPDTLNITTSFYPMYIFTLNIAKDIPSVKVTNLTKPTTGCLHDYSLVPQEMKALESTDIFVANGGGMESFLDKVTKTIPKDHIIDSSLGVEPISSNGIVNPHFFVSISNAINQVENISNGLIKLDPKHKKQYLANTKAYIARLTTLKDKMHLSLANIKRQKYHHFP